MQPLHTVLRPSTALDATAETFTNDLPVNPLSVILVTLRALNNIAATSYADYAASVTALMSKISNIRAAYRGATIFDADPLDLAMVYGMFSKWWPIAGQTNQINNDVRSVTFPLLFGRKAFDPTECFPASRRGDLVLTTTTAADPTGLDGFTMIIETIELLDAVPTRFIKVTSSAFSLAAGDVNDISLPIGNKLLGVLCRSGLFPTAASNDAGFNEVALEVDNVEVMQSRATWRGLHALWARRTRTDWLQMGHRHLLDIIASTTDPVLTTTALGLSGTAAAGSSLITGNDAATLGHFGVAPHPEQDALQRYGLVDLDLLDDLSMALDTKGAADINLHVNASAADTAARVLPIEYVETGAATA